MRILYLLGQDFPDRQTQCIQVMRMGVAFARHGVRTRLLVRRLLVEDRREVFARFGLEPEPGFEIEALREDRLGPLGRWRGVPFLARLGRLEIAGGREETIVYSRDLPGIEPARLAAILGRVTGAPVFYEVHKIYARRMAEFYRDETARKEEESDYVARKRRRLARIRWRETGMLRTVRGVVAINESLERRLRAMLGPRRPIAVVPSAAHVPDRVPGDEERDLDVVYLGHVGELKGVTVLVEAMAHLPGRRLLIHGRARTEASLERLRAAIRDHGLEGRVTFGGWIPPAEVPALLDRARASALPYRAGWTETSEFVSPLKLFELMAHGVPVVASNLPSIRETVRDGETGLLVAADDPVALAAALRRLLEDRPLAGRLADAARRAVSGSSWSERAGRILAFIEETLRDRSRRAARSPDGRP